MTGSAVSVGASTPLADRVVAIYPGPVQPAPGYPPVINRTDQVEVHVAVRPNTSVACTVTLKYRGKVFGGGTFTGPVPNGQVTIPALAYSRSRTSRGVEASLNCALAKKQSGVALKKGQSGVALKKGQPDVLFTAPVQEARTEGP